MPLEFPPHFDAFDEQGRLLAQGALRMPKPPRLGSIAYMSKTLFPSHRVQKPPKGIDAITACGFAHGSSADGYTLLPFGLRMFEKLCVQVNTAFGDEYSPISMPIIQREELWKRSGRYTALQDGLAIVSLHSGTYVINPTQEEAIANLIASIAPPKSLYPLRLMQISERLRNVTRPSGGLLRSSCFQLGEIFTISLTPEQSAIERARLEEAATRLWHALDLTVRSASRSATQDALSYIVPSETAGQQHVAWQCASCSTFLSHHGNEECPKCKETLIPVGAVEIGDCVSLSTSFSDSMGFHAPGGGPVYLNYIGLGLSRVQQMLLEKAYSPYGMALPINVAPYHVYIAANGERAEEGAQFASTLRQLGWDIAFDDRPTTGMGRKLIDAELSGAPIICILGNRANREVELRDRLNHVFEAMATDQSLNYIDSRLSNP